MPTSATGKRKPSTSPSKSCGQAGFTLVELLVVMSIAAILATFAAPALRQIMPGLEQRATVDRISDELRRARSNAILQNRETWLEFDLDAGTFRRSGGTKAHQTADDARISVLTARREIVNGRQARIRFFPDGASTGGVIELALSGCVRQINVDWFDGGVHVDACAAG